MLRTVLFRTALTGVLTFLFVVVVLSLVIQRVVHRPLHQLMEGFLHVGRGNFNYWVTVDARGEFQEMADQFNVMSRAIGRSFTEIRRKNWETASLYTFVQQLSRAIEWNKLRRIITNLLLETFAAAKVMLLLRREGKEGDVFEISWRQANDRRFYHKEHAALVQNGKLPAWIIAQWEEWRQDPLMPPHFTANDAKAILPLASKNIAIGLICLERGNGGRFSEAEKKLVLAVGEQIGISLANARLYRLAITDDLKGLYTRRYCETIIRKFLDAHESGGNGAFCVLMLDLDHFKEVNDTCGHQVGDEVLAQVAGLLRASIRYDDIACRYGGEEFIIVVPGHLEVGREAGCRLREIVDQHVFASEVGPLDITVSIGIAGFPEHGRSGEAVIGAVYKALYEAKERGRNRVICFGGQE